VELLQQHEWLWYPPILVNASLEKLEEDEVATALHREEEKLVVLPARITMSGSKGSSVNLK
jgi:hypothetical protein